jgi:ArsR family transcriptional regulator
MRLELFGPNSETFPLLALLDEEWVVGDLGCGTGQIARTIAPFVQRVVAVDASPAMLAAARPHASSKIEFREGALERLPITDGELDVALLFLVLHYVIDPTSALQEAVRALKPGGRLLIVDMMPHDQAELRESMGHLWPGFAPEQINTWLNAAGFARVQHTALPVGAGAKGPALFAAKAIKPMETEK